MMVVRAFPLKRVSIRRGQFFEVEDVPLHYTRKLRNIVTINRSCKAHYAEVCDQAVHLCRRGSSYVDLLSIVEYKGHSYV